MVQFSEAVDIYQENTRTRVAYIFDTVFRESSIDEVQRKIIVIGPIKSINTYSINVKS